MATKEEVKQEMIRRGLLPQEEQSQEAQSPSHEDLKAEMMKRGLLPEQQTNPSLPLRIGADVLAGAAQFGQGIQNAPRNIAEKFAPSLAKYTQEPTDINFGKMMGINNPNWMDKLLQGSVKSAPYAIAGGASLLGQVLGGMTEGATQEKDPLLGAALGTVGGATGYGTAKGAASLPQGYQLAKNFLSKARPEVGTPEAQFSAQAGDLPIPYAGEKLYNKVLSNIPFSGVEKNVEKVGEAAKDTADTILGTLKGPVAEEDVPASIIKANKQNRIAIKKTSNNKYEDLGRIAEEKGINVKETPYLSTVAAHYLRENKKRALNIDEDLKAHLKNLTKLHEPEIKKEIQGDLYSGLAREKTTEIPKELPFNELHKMKKSYLETSRRSERSSPIEAKIFGDLGAAAKKDMNLTAEKTKDPEFINRLNDADAHYATHVVPHNSSLGKRLNKGTQNINTLATSLLNGTDHATKLLSDLPVQARNQLGYLKLKNAIKETSSGKKQVDPAKLFNLYSSLDETQKQALFDPLTRTAFRQLGFLAQHSKSLGKNTGKVAALEIGTPILEALSMHPGLALKTGGVAALTTLGARGATKALTDPRLRNAYLAMQGQQNMSIDPSILAALRSAGMGGVMGGQQ
jgi:hypothetical protein